MLSGSLQCSTITNDQRVCGVKSEGQDVRCTRDEGGGQENTLLSIRLSVQLSEAGVTGASVDVGAHLEDRQSSLLSILSLVVS